MDYLTSLKMTDSTKQQKAALITEHRTYTYAELIKAAQSIRDTADFAPNCIFIHEDEISAQLIKFIAYSGTETVPVIATKISRQQQFAAEDIPPRACMGVMTSGSTGKSKLLWRSCESWADFFPEQNKIFGLSENSIIFCQGSLAFTGNLNIYMGVLAAGGTIVAADKFAPKKWLAMINEYKVNAIYMIPSKLMVLIKAATAQNHNVHHIISGSQSMGRRKAAELKHIFPNTDITLYYGASELNYITYIKDADMTDDETLIGKPFRGVHISIDHGEILVSTPYGIENIKMPFSLKDKGYIDENGNLHFQGRSDDIVNVNGIKISAYKVERAIMRLLPCREAAVLALHHGGTDLLAAFAVLNEGRPIARADLLKALRQELIDYEIPKKFIYLNELPKNESGKIDRFALSELHKTL